MPNIKTLTEEQRLRINASARESQRRWRAENPGLHRARAKAWKAANRERFEVRNKAWRQANREHLRKQSRVAYFRQKYRLTIEQRDDMLAAQGGVCAICRRLETARRGWAVDHCHATGRVRGILCQACNLVLGHAEDDTKMLRSMIEYLENG
jgi:hypothetical protein